MPISEQKRDVFRFGVFELDTAGGVLRKYGIKLKLQDQPCQILTLLLERAGEPITREEIRNRLWPGDTYVDFDNAINSAVRKIRDALGDASENPRFVETLARRGYRFIAPVSREGCGPAVGDAPSTELHPAALPDPKPPTTKRHLWWTFGSLVMVLIAGATAARWWVANSKHAASNAPLPAVPLTGNSGYEMFPAISPEGTRVAYAWEQSRRQFPDIDMKLIGEGDPVRLTTSPAGDYAPANLGTP